MKIGLMYVSDYGFAASNSYWTTTLSGYSSATSSNWLYLGSDEGEWTISREESTKPFVQSGVFRIYYNGGVSTFTIPTVGDINVHRPCFYLTSAITYVSGSGMSTDPIRIN